MIPARNEPFLRRTIDQALDNAAGDVEVIVMLDGDPPYEPIQENARVTVLSNERPKGIGAASMAMAVAARGEYVMKCDAHCMFMPGYDEVLKADCDYRWLAVPSRYQLRSETPLGATKMVPAAEAWSRGYGPIDYCYLTYPYLGEPQFGGGLHGKKWLGENGLEGGYFWREEHDRDVLIDDCMALQGSLFFMHRQRFLELGGVDPRYWLWQESTSIAMKVWESGGRCVTNKKTWYAHLHKGRKFGRGYSGPGRQQVWADTRHSADYWMHDCWDSPLRTRGIHWWVERFWPIPGWPDDWDDPKYEQSFVWPGG